MTVRDTCRYVGNLCAALSVGTFAYIWSRMYLADRILPDAFKLAAAAVFVFAVLMFWQIVGRVASRSSSQQR